MTQSRQRNEWSIVHSAVIMVVSLILAVHFALYWLHGRHLVDLLTAAAWVYIAAHWCFSRLLPALHQEKAGPSEPGD